MEMTIISHNLATALARIRFEHAGITVENNFNLRHVIPGTDYIFSAMGIDFVEEYQTKAIEKLAASIEAQIDSGAIQNAPEPAVPDPVEPEPEEEPTATPPGPAPEEGA